MNTRYLINLFWIQGLYLNSSLDSSFLFYFHMFAILYYIPKKGFNSMNTHLPHRLCQRTHPLNVFLCLFVYLNTILLEMMLYRLDTVCIALLAIVWFHLWHFCTCREKKTEGFYDMDTMCSLRCHLYRTHRLGLLLHHVTLQLRALVLQHCSQFIPVFTWIRSLAQYCGYWCFLSHLALGSCLKRQIC